MLIWIRHANTLTCKKTYGILCYAPGTKSERTSGLHHGKNVFHVQKSNKNLWFNYSVQHSERI